MAACIIGHARGGVVAFRAFVFSLPLERIGRALILHWRTPALVSALLEAGVVGRIPSPMPSALSASPSGPHGALESREAFWREMEAAETGAFLFVDGRWEMRWPDGSRERVVEALVRLDRERDPRP